MSEAGADGWHHFGAHRLRYEAPGLVCISVNGDLFESDVHAILAAIRQGKDAAGGGALLVLVDVSRMGDFLPAARKAAVSPEHHRLQHISLIVGARTAHRVVLKLMETAYRLVSRDPHITPIMFFDTEAEARAWLAQRRDERLVPQS